MHCRKLELERTDGQTGQNLCPWFVIVFPWDELDGIGWDGMRWVGRAQINWRRGGFLSFFFISSFFLSDLDWFLAGGHGPIKCGPDGGEVGGRGGRGGIITIRYYCCLTVLLGYDIMMGGR